MVDYTWTTSEGHIVTEYRPFNAGIAVRYSPCMPDWRCSTPSHASHSEFGYSDDKAKGPADSLTAITGQQLKFGYLSKDVLQQLLLERATIRDRNRSAILNRLSDVSGQMYGTTLVHSPDSYRRKQGLEKTKLDLERQLREEDVTMWRDCLELRRELILADKAYSGTRQRQELMINLPSLDDDKGQGRTGISG
jgi:hypothetical protein